MCNGNGNGNAHNQCAMCNVLALAFVCRAAARVDCNELIRGMLVAELWLRLRLAAAPLLC